MTGRKRDIPTPYRLIRSRRRSVSIRVTEEAETEVRAPERLPKGRIDALVESKRGWIEKQLERARRIRAFRDAAQKSDPFLPQRREGLRRKAPEVLKRRVEELSGVVPVRINGVRVNGAEKRWGSCSAKGNISLSWRLMLLPRELSDYVIVHELCHRLQMNHSESFWLEVERVLPDYRERRRALRNWQEKLLMEGW